MLISIITYGSTGDILPYISLGKALVDRGFDVRLIAHDQYRQAIEGCGMEYLRGFDDAKDLLATDEGKGLLKEKPIRSLIRLNDIISPYLMEIARNTLDAAKGSDAIVFSIMGGIVAHDIAEAMDVPAIGAYVMPLSPTSRMSNFMLPVNLPSILGIFNRLSFYLPMKTVALAFRKSVNRVRTKILGLPPFSMGQARVWDGGIPAEPTVYGISPSLFRRPSDWGDWTAITGYWFPLDDEGWSPEPSLKDFIESGERPIYIGFGSMGTDNPERTFDIVREALRLAGRRGIVAKGWDGMAGEATDDIYVSDFIPHGWLFGKVDGIVHHGGSGTTAQGFRAGVPQVITPFFADQYFWRRTVVEHGCGPLSKPHTALNPRGLASAIEKLPEYTDRAKEVSGAISTERGVENAVKFIERHLEKMIRIW